MSEGAWYVDGDGGAVEAEDDLTYDEAYGPRDPHPHDGRLVEDDEGSHTDVTSEAVAHVAVGDTAWKSAEEAAIHVVDDTELMIESAIDDDHLPVDPLDR